MKKHILNNLHLKLLALALAVITWLIVVNVSNPYTTKTISGIPITIENEDSLLKNNYTYTVTGSQTATIRVRAPRKTVQALNAADFQATADLSRLYEPTGQIPVTVTSKSSRISNDEITQITQSLDIKLEAITSRKFDVAVFTEGTPADGYQVGNITASPSVITVTAPQSFLDQIASVGVVVNVDSVSKDVNQHVTATLYNAGGNVLNTEDVKHLSLSSSDVDVTVQIMNVKDVGITGKVSGTDAVARGYRYAGMTIEPETVSVYGRKKVLADLSSLSLPDGTLDVTNATEDVVQTYHFSDLQLPDGVSLADDADTEFTVTLHVEKTNTKTFKLPISSLTIRNLDDSLQIQNTGDTLNVTVEGLSGDLDALQASEISAVLNLKGLKAGTSTVTADVTVPDGFSVVGTAQVSVNLVEVNGETTVAENQNGQTAKENTAAPKATVSEGEKSGEDLK